MIAPRGSRRGSPIICILAIIAGIVAITIAASGGFSLRLSGVRISSRGTLRPALFALLFFTLAYRTRPAWQKSDVSRGVGRVLWAVTPWLPPIAAVVVLALCWMYGTRVAGGSDIYGYVSQAHLWLAGDLRVQQGFAASVVWPNADWTFTPLGYRPGPNHTIVPTYAPGLPLLMALSTRVIGSCGPFVVTPLCGALLVLLTFALGVQLTGRVTGALAALLTASSPTILMMTLWPMSDVPAAAFWTMSLVMGLRGGSIAPAIFAGICAGIAIVIRPNLVPLLAFPAAFVFLTSSAAARARFSRLAALAAGCLPFVIFVAYVNYDLYGSFLASGYGEATSIYKWRNLGPNLIRYPRWLWATHGLFAFLFLAAAAVPSGPDVHTRNVRWLLLAYIASVFACYIFYGPFDDWWYLRFVIPAMPVMFLLGIDALWRLTTRAGGAFQVSLIVLITGLTMYHAIAYARQHSVFDIGEGEQKYADVGRYLEQTLPAHTVVLASQHSGSIRYYAGLKTLKFELLDRAWLDRAIEYLKSTGANPYIVLEGWEIPNFRRQFAGQRAVALLDRPAVAVHSRQVFVFSSDLAQRSDSPQTIPHTKGCE